MILYIFLCAMFLRLVSLYVSYRNEKQLRQNGAKEHGKINTIALTLAHVAFYLIAIKESIFLNRQVNNLTYMGITLFIMSMLVLLFVMIRLGKHWTVKLILPANESINNPVSYRTLRRSNYFLNVIPELIAITMICQSWFVLRFGLPLYLIPLLIRIIQEERLMRTTIRQRDI